MPFKNKSEKNAYRIGYLNGLKRNKSTKYQRKPWYKTRAGEIAMRYARHMGDKFNLSDDQVLLNSLDHYTRMQKDKSYKADLYKQYDYKK